MEFKEFHLSLHMISFLGNLFFIFFCNSLAIMSHNCIVGITCIYNQSTFFVHYVLYVYNLWMPWLHYVPNYLVFIMDLELVFHCVKFYHHHDNILYQLVYFFVGLCVVANLVVCLHMHTNWHMLASSCHNLIS